MRMSYAQLRDISKKILVIGKCHSGKQKVTFILVLFYRKNGLAFTVTGWT